MPASFSCCGRPGRTTVIVPAPQVELLAPGQERTFDLPVTFGAPTWRATPPAGPRRAVRPEPRTGRHTHSYPWGLVLLVVLASGYVTVRWSRHARRVAAPVARPPT